MSKTLKRLMKENRKKFWEKYKDFYDKIPLNCKLCKEFLEDGTFLEDGNEVPYGCGETGSATEIPKPDFFKHCDYFKFEKFRLVSILRKSFKRIKELERLVQIHETFMGKQYQYDKGLIMRRFDKLEKKVS